MNVQQTAAPVSGKKPRRAGVPYHVGQNRTDFFDNYWIVRSIYLMQKEQEHDHSENKLFRRTHWPV